MWPELLLAFGGNATLLVVLGLLFKSLLSQMLTKDLEKYKTELKADSDVAIEQLKSRLQITALEHQVRFSKLHEKRAEVLAELHEQIVESFFDAYQYVTRYAGSGSDEHYLKVEKKIFAFNQFFELHRIYLPKHINDLIQTLTNALRTHVVAVWSYGVDFHLFSPQIATERATSLKKAFESFSTGDIEKARDAIETEFRKLLEGEKPVQPASPQQR
jgi:hypothetical protein